jgi:hypothetical protein
MVWVQHAPAAGLAQSPGQSVPKLGSPSNQCQSISLSGRLRGAKDRARGGGGCAGGVSRHLLSQCPRDGLQAGLWWVTTATACTHGWVCAGSAYIQLPSCRPTLSASTLLWGSSLAGSVSSSQRVRQHNYLLCWVHHGVSVLIRRRQHAPVLVTAAGCSLLL